MSKNPELKSQPIPADEQRAMVLNDALALAANHPNENLSRAIDEAIVALERALAALKS